MRAAKRKLVTPRTCSPGLAEVQPGSSLTIAILRGAEEHKVTATFPDADV